MKYWYKKLGQNKNKTESWRQRLELQKSFIETTSRFIHSIHSFLLLFLFDCFFTRYCFTGTSSFVSVVTESEIIHSLSFIIHKQLTKFIIKNVSIIVIRFKEKLKMLAGAVLWLRINLCSTNCLKPYIDRTNFKNIPLEMKDLWTYPRIHDLFKKWKDVDLIFDSQTYLIAVPSTLFCEHAWVVRLTWLIKS